jgi:subtilisin family serine protease
MKCRYTTLLVCLLFATLAANAAMNPKISFDTYVFLDELKNNKTIPTKSNYVTLQQNDTIFAKCYVTTNESYNMSELKTLGATEILRTKSAALISVPVDNITKLADFDGINAIEIARSAKPTLNKALPLVGVDKVLTGETPLKQPYTGKGVIVGIADWGFDFTHPMFLDANGDLRIKRAWVTANKSGNPPASFTYGTLFTDSEYLRDSVRYSAAHSGHGSHCLGIAAGTEVQGTKLKLGGIARDADLAVVDLTGGGSGSDDDPASATSVIEGVHYLMQYADSMQKPTVINLSLGYNNPYHGGDGMGPADILGKEVIAQYPKGKIVVVSAGNEGGNFSHIKFTPTDEMDSCFSRSTMTDLGADLKNVYLSFWGTPGHNFTVSTYIYHRQELYELEEFSTENIVSGTKDYEFSDTAIDAKFHSIYSVGLQESNQKPYIHLNLFVNDDKSYALYFVLRSDTVVHFWNNNGGGFSNRSSNITPDAYYTIGSPGTLEDVITVGAYVSRKDGPFNGGGGMLNSYATFTSRGPTTDERMKPDISAPGAEVFSAKNNFYSGYDSYIVDYTMDSSHSFVSLCGTSMSAPVVSGIVALMLERNPNLTSAQIKEVLKATAINDSYTGNAKEEKNRIWGWGKIDAFAIMQYLEYSDIAEEHNIDFFAYPNPTKDFANIVFTTKRDGNVKLEILNAMGQVLMTPVDQFYETGNHITNIDCSQMATGAYFIRMTNGKLVETTGFVIN